MYQLATLLAFSLLAQTSYAQLPGATTTGKTPAAEKPAEQDPYDRESPRGCIIGFLKAAEREDYTQSFQYLDVRASLRNARTARNFPLSGSADPLKVLANVLVSLPGRFR